MTKQDARRNGIYNVIHFKDVEELKEVLEKTDWTTFQTDSITIFRKDDMSVITDGEYVQISSEAVFRRGLFVNLFIIGGHLIVGDSIEI